MAIGATALEPRREMEDILAYLPASTLTEYKPRQVIYGAANVSTSVYLVVTGKVGISRIADTGGEVLLEIIRPDEIFGESAFYDAPCLSERATAIEKSRLMAWPVSDMEDLVTKRPRLAVALLQLVARRNAEFAHRIESFSLENVERRLARSLVRFSERLGVPEEDGSISMLPLTHEMLSQYVGTSRELVTQHMNAFRRKGFLSYSRRGIRINPLASQAWLDDPRGGSCETANSDAYASEDAERDVSCVD